jgi:betaine lipid synthase
MLLNEGTAYEFVRDTLDPLASTYSFKNGAYFYLLTLLGHYTPSSCPSYLTRAGFDALKANNAEAMDAFRLHTDSIVGVLRGLTNWSLTRAVIMDHLDWFTPGAAEVEEEVDEFRRVLAPGGFVLWRSAARRPWYNVV